MGNPRTVCGGPPELPLGDPWSCPWVPKSCPKRYPEQLMRDPRSCPWGPPEQPGQQSPAQQRGRARLWVQGPMWGWVCGPPSPDALGQAWCKEGLHLLSRVKRARVPRMPQLGRGSHPTGVGSRAPRAGGQAAGARGLATPQPRRPPAKRSLRGAGAGGSKLKANLK